MDGWMRKKRGTTQQKMISSLHHHESGGDGEGRGTGERLTVETVEDLLDSVIESWTEATTGHDRSLHILRMDPDLCSWTCAHETVGLFRHPVGADDVREDDFIVHDLNERRKKKKQ